MAERSYYAIIPASVRYDKNLSSSAKLMYGEITALCNEKGFCWAKNQYFEELYGVGKNTVIRWIKELEDGGYIAKNLQYENDGKTVLARCLSITPNDTRWYQKCDPEGIKNDTTPSPKNDTSYINNNTRENTTSNNNTPKGVKTPGITARFQTPSLEEVEAFCNERQNNVDAVKFYNYYESVGWCVGNKSKPMKNWKACVITWERTDNRKPQLKKDSSMDALQEALNAVRGQ